MRSLFVVGTAGHIDHGKSALVKALTGIDPDRLEEEQRRGMTIDLGFAHFDLPSGRRVGIVDVPGHERLIKNMLAGATGIDMVLLVVAADEGVMPQTREHLDILRYLPVRQGITVLNKIDLVEDSSWLELVKEDLSALVAGTFLERAPVVDVSARTGQGIPALVATMDRLLDAVTPRPTDAPVRLPIDRAFVMAGFGTVVTGTLWSGQIGPGDVLELLPQHLEVRVRGVQSHGQTVEAGIAGSRVAVNLVGVEKEQIERGNVLATPGVLAPTALLDVHVHLLPGTPAVAHLARVRLYLGSDEAIGRLSLLDRPRLDPGNSMVGQIRLERPIVAVRGDPFVLRRFSPMLTIGGGEVVDPHPPKRRRGTASVAAILESSVAGSDERIERLLLDAGRDGVSVDDFSRKLGASKAEIEHALTRLTAANRSRAIRGRLFHGRILDEVAAAIQREVDAYHTAKPWRLGVPKDELKARVFGSGDNRLYAHVMEELVNTRIIEEAGAFIRRPGFAAALTPQETRVRAKIARALREGRYAPPSRREIARNVNDSTTFDRMFQALLDEGLVIEAAPGIFFHKDVLEEIRSVISAEVEAAGSITVAVLRDRLQTSRKFALTVLEYFDTIRVTRRVGDARVLVGRPGR